MKKSKKFLILSLSFILVVVIFTISTILIINRYTINNIKVDNGNITYNIIEDIKPNNTLKGSNISKIRSTEKLIKDIDIVYNGSKLNLYIYEKDLRYYIDMDLYFNKLNKKLKNEDKNYIIYNNNEIITLNKKDKKYFKDEKWFDLRGEILNINNKDYISINDLETMLDLRSTWDIDNKRIYMYIDKKHKSKKEIVKKGKASFIRLEDVCSGGYFASSESKEKMKILGDNLYSKGVSFHIAWIPRYKSPDKRIDNDLLTNKSLDNIQFINMMDYLIQKGGTIGLHGYTHQCGNSTSAGGFELTMKLNNSEEKTREIIEKGIITAKTLNIPISFYESPHYGATYRQQKIIGKYFNILYENHSNIFTFNPLYDLNKKGTLYIPTPYGYVKDDYGYEMVNKIKNGKGVFLVSLFIHPYKETKFINLSKIDKFGYRDYKYNKISPINNIIDELHKRGYKTTYVTDLQKN